MKITILDAKTLGQDIDLSVFEQFGEFEIHQTTTKDQTIQRIQYSDIVITNKVIIDKAVLDACQNLKLICISATGMNNVDLEYARQKRVKVTNVAGYSTKSVAQHTFSMLFYLLGQMRYYDEYVQSGQWEKDTLFTHIAHPFYEISGKKWGIIGMGTIGGEVAKIASAFGSQIQYYSTSGQNSNQPYTQVSLNQLLSECDIISIHAPLNDQTQNLIAKEQLALIKEDAVLLNLGRGGIINEEDLANALENKRFFTGLDVTQFEPLSNQSPLFGIKDKQRLLITPHIAWTSIEAREILLQGIVQNIKDYLRDHTL